jgi:hypothetical protein
MIYTIGQLLAGHYRVLQVLGAGRFGQTYIAKQGKVEISVEMG